MLRRPRKSRSRVIFWAVWTAFVYLAHRELYPFVQAVTTKHLSAEARLLSLSMRERTLILVFAVAAAPLSVTAPPLDSASLRAATLPSKVFFAQETAGCNAEACAVEGRERTAASVQRTRHFWFPAVGYTGALPVNVAAGDTAAAGGSRSAGSGSVQVAATFSPWHVVAAEAAAFQGPLGDTGSHTKRNAADQGGAETAQKSRNYAEVDKGDHTREDSTVDPVLDGTSSSQVEEDDILSFLQVALGAAVILAVSTWLLLEQRKALNRARYDRLTDLLGT